MSMVKDVECSERRFLRKHPPLSSPLGRKWGKARREALRVIDEHPDISSIELWRLMNSRGVPINKVYARKLRQRAFKNWVFLSRSKKHNRRISIPIVKKPKLKSFNVKAWWNSELFSPFNGVLVTDFIYLDSTSGTVIDGILKHVRGLCVRRGKHVTCYLPFEVHRSGVLMGRKTGRHVGFRVPFRFAGVHRTCFGFLRESGDGGFPRFFVFDRSKRHLGTEQIEFDSLETAVFFFNVLFDGYGLAEWVARLRVKELCGFHGRGHKRATRRGVITS